MKARTLHPTQGVRRPPGDRHELFDQPIGTVIEDPDCWQLVKCGVAEPADEECAAKCGMTPEQIAAASKVYAATDAGIAPEDRELFYNGVITGYRGDYDPANDPPSTEYIPGPNWTEEFAAELDGHDPDDEDEDEEPADEPTPATDAQQPAAA